jgi:hypothetical protein
VKLSPEQRKRQHNPNALIRVTKSIRISCVYNQKKEYITVPTDSVFDGDSLKRRLGITNHGIAWVIHDWMYSVKTFDRGKDDLHTTVPNRWSIDELMYDILHKEGSIAAIYGTFLRAFDVFGTKALERAWQRRDQTQFVYQNSPIVSSEV